MTAREGNKMFTVNELHGCSDCPDDYGFDGERFRHLFVPSRDAALFATKEEAMHAIANAPRRANSTIAIIERK
jgi:hypothetical protein